MEPYPPLPAPGRCLLARVDYGYAVGLPAGWRREELDWAGRAPFSESWREGLWVCGAESLVGWARTKAGEAIWERLRTGAAKGNLVLQCRFPRYARELAGMMEARGMTADRWETPADGRVPPLYEELERRPDLRRLHLEHEWLTGVAAARGGIALLRIASILARGPQPAAGLAEPLGLTSGAVRSYLSWMEDTALVRREGRAFALRHPLLATLFPSTPAASAPPAPAPRPRAAAPPPPAPPPEPTAPREPVRPRWDPVELD